jgi:hypothetical protein
LNKEHPKTCTSGECLSLFNASSSFSTMLFN